MLHLILDCNVFFDLQSPKIVWAITADHAGARPVNSIGFRSY